MVVSAVEQAGEVPGFADRLGDRLVVPQPSGALLEFLRFQSQLSSAAFFESAVKTRLKRLSNFRHGAYSRATRLQRDPAHGNRLTLVSIYSPGRRLSDVLALARRGKIQPRIPAVLSLARQLMTGVALLHDYAPDVFHGALGTDRLVVTPEGHLVITEYVLGSAVEQAVSEWGTVRLWRDFRVPALSDTTLSRFGRRLDLVQIGLVALSLLLGRPLSDEEYPARLPDLLAAAEEHHGEGDKAPLGAALREWLGKLLCLDPATSFRTLIEAQKAFVRLVEDEPRYGVSSHALESFFQQCEEAALLPLVTPSGAVPVAAPVTPEPAPAVTPEPVVEALSPALVAEPAPAAEAVEVVVPPVVTAPPPPEPPAAATPVIEPALAVTPAVPIEPPVLVESAVRTEPAVRTGPAVPTESAVSVEPAVPADRPVASMVAAVAPGPVVAAPDAVAGTAPSPVVADGRSLDEAARAAAEDAEPAALPVAPLEPSASGPEGASGVADPFGPWPVVVGTDTVATLFDTFKTPDSTRESPVVEIPAPVVPEVAAELPPTVVTNSWDLGLGNAPQETREWVESTEATAARQLRETLFEAAPASAPAEPVLSDPGPVAVPAWEPSFAPHPGRPAVEVVVVEPPGGLTAPAAALAPPVVEPPRPESVRLPAEPRLIEPPRASEPVREEPQGAERRVAPAVLSYEEVHNASVPRRSRLPLVATAAAVILLAVVGAVAGPRVLSMVRGATTARKETVPQPASAVAPGGFRITTLPPGGKINIDGVPRGTAPLKVEDLAAGLHSISVESEWGTMEEAVNVEPGKVVPLALATVGWIRVESPVELEVSEEGKSYGRTGGQLMVPAGRHHFVFVNQSVAARLRQFVDVPPGQVVKVVLDLPPGMLNLTSEQPAQVLLDGELLGDTPLVSVQAKLGPHEVIFRSSRYGDVSYSINVTLAAPVRLNCTFAKR
jgi:hypothetical protein